MNVDVKYVDYYLNNQYRLVVVILFVKNALLNH